MTDRTPMALHDTPRRSSPGSFRVLGIAVLVLVAGHAAAQSSGQPERNPGGLGADDPERLARELRQKADSATLRATDTEVLIPPVRPATADPARPGLVQGVDWLEGLEDGSLDVPGPTVLPERSFLTNRAGRVVPGPFGTWIFAPRSADRSPGERAMMLLPGRVTQRVASAAGEDAALPIEVSGEIFLYHGRNYILPSAFRVARELTPSELPPADGKGAADPIDATHGDAPVEGNRPTEPMLDVAGEEDVGSLIAELRAQRGRSGDGGATAERPVAAETPQASGGGSGRQRGDVSGLISEGELLSKRRGRIERLADGMWAFVTDNEASADTASGGSGGPGRGAIMRLLPCTMLTLIELTAQTEGDLRAVTLSGRVTVYDGENYLLPILLRVERGTEIRSLQ